MDWNALLIEIMPLLSQLLFVILSAVLIFLTTKANAWIVANTEGSQLVLINMVAKQVVLFLEQVGEARGWASSEGKKEYAVNRLIEDLAKVGVAITMQQADMAIEAAVKEFASEVSETLGGLTRLEPGTITP